MTRILGKTFSGIIIDELSDSMINTFTLEETAEVLKLKQSVRDGVIAKLQDPLYDIKFYNFIFDNCVVAGGCSVSMYHGEAPKDYDLYFKSAEALKELDSYLNKGRINLVKDVNPNYMSTTVSGKLITNHAITLFNDVQLITMGTKDMIDGFDFIHCKPLYDLSSGLYYISKNQFKSIKRKELISNPNSNQKIQRYRLHKFKERGWNISKDLLRLY